MGKKKKTPEVDLDEEIEALEEDLSDEVDDIDDEEEEYDDIEELEEELAEDIDHVDLGEEEDEIFEERSEIARQFEMEETEDITEERTYTVPLAKAYLRPPNKRARRAITLLKQFFVRHMKPEELIILPEVNEYIFERGMVKPPRKVKIRATKSLEGVVTLYLTY